MKNIRVLAIGNSQWIAKLDKEILQKLEETYTLEIITEEQAYAKTGATIDIGYESDLYPIFTKEMTAKVVNHAKEKKYGMLSYWSINRDAQMEPNKGVNTKYEFLNELNKMYK